MAGVWQKRVTTASEGLNEGDVAIVKEGPDKEGDYKLCNTDGEIVGGEDWIPFRAKELVLASETAWFGWVWGGLGLRDSSEEELQYDLLAEQDRAAAGKETKTVPEADGLSKEFALKDSGFWEGWFMVLCLVYVMLFHVHLEIGWSAFWDFLL